MRSRCWHRKLGGLAAALVVAAMTATTAVAGGKTTVARKCGTWPTAVMNGSGYSLVGSGFTAGIGVTVYVSDPGSTTWTYKGIVARDGTFSIPALANFTYAGTKSLYINKTGDRKMQTLCSAQFSVQ